MRAPAFSPRTRRISEVLRAAGLAAAALTVVSGCVGSGGEEPESDQSPSKSSTAEPESGGPIGRGVPDIGGVRTDAVENDSIQLATVPPAKGGSADIGVEFEPKLTIDFASARREGNGVVFTAEAEYHGEKGGYELHSNDFIASLYKEDRPEDASWAEQFDFFPVQDDGMLATLDTEKPTQKFSFTVPKVRTLAGGTGLDSFGYIEYRTPDELWGYSRKQRDVVPGRVCYQEGKAWHDMPLFPETEVPCG